MKIHGRLYGLSLALLIGAAAPAFAQDVQKGGMDETGPYDVVVGWFKPGIDRWDQRVVSVVADTPNRIIIGSNDRSLTLAGYPLLAADGTVLKEKTTVPTDMSPAKIQVNQLMVLNGDGKMIEITECGQFRGSVEIENADIAGRYDGQLVVHGRLTVRSTGRISGTVKYGELEVNAGGQIIGEIQHIDIRDGSNAAVGEGVVDDGFIDQQILLIGFHGPHQGNLGLDGLGDALEWGELRFARHRRPQNLPPTSGITRVRLPTAGNSGMRHACTA